MFTLDQINEIEKKAVTENATYPQLFEALKSIGVERYETNVLTHEIRYFGGGTSVAKPAPEGWETLTGTDKYDLEALKKAIGRVQKRETSYGEFLSEIAAAGVSFYRVDMKPRTVTYHGKKPYKYVEEVPKP